MPYVKNAVFGFVALLIVLVAGFWKTYFSVLFQGLDRTHHFHGIVMLAWVLLLINQAWLARTGRFDIHRITGKISYLLGPLVVMSGIVVTYFNPGRLGSSPASQSLIPFGLFLSLLFGLLYGLAMYYRKSPDLHARYMITTGLVFLVPGLGRMLNHIQAPLGLSLPLHLVPYTPGTIGLLLIAADWRHGRIRAPFVVFTVIWATYLLVRPVLP